MPKIGQRFNPHRLFTGIFIPDAVYRIKGLSPIAKLLYGRLCKYAGESGEAYPAGTTLAEEIGISERQVFEHLGRLVDVGLIEREPRAGTSTVYHFIWGELLEEPGGVVRKTALLGEHPNQCGNPHQGSAENRTTGSAENRTLRESIEENQGTEETQGDFNPEERPQLSPARKRIGKPWSRKPADLAKEARKESAKRQRDALKDRWTAGAGSAAGQDRSPSPSATNTGTSDKPDDPGEDYAALWNEFVPACCVKADTSRDVRVSQEISANPELAEKFYEVALKSQGLISLAPDKFPWITFRWILAENAKQRRPNWELLLAGYFDGMADAGRGKPPKLAYLDGVMKELGMK